jgi:hypothetical protein
VCKNEASFDSNKVHKSESGSVFTSPNVRSPLPYPLNDIHDVVTNLSAVHLILILVLYTATIFHVHNVVGLFVNISFSITIVACNFTLAFMYLYGKARDINVTLSFWKLFDGVKNKVKDFIRRLARWMLRGIGDEPEVKFVSHYDQMKDLGEEDRIFRERKAVLDLTRRNTPPAEYKNFCILMSFFDLPNILVELDLDSQISLVSESYFLEYLKPKMRLYNYTSEPPMTFKGLGSSITSKYPPLHLDFRVGGFNYLAGFMYRQNSQPPQY